MRRNEINFIYDILRACRNPLIITRIMYATNINGKILKKHILILMSKGFITETRFANNSRFHGERKYSVKYAITAKGSLFLSQLTPLIAEFQTMYPQKDFR